MLFKKIHNDYFMKSKLKDYMMIIETAKTNGYKMMGMLDFFEYLRVHNGVDVNDKILLNRHDVDTSPRVAFKMFNIEKSIYKNDGTSCFYFRKTTLDKRVIKAIEDGGFETGFHYETIANYELKRKARCKETLVAEFEKMEPIFLSELEMYRAKSCTKSISVASHGDFINVKLDLPNYTLLQNLDLRKKAHIKLEAYDDSVCKYIEARFADHKLGESFCNNVISELQKGTRIIMILTHPRNWAIDPFESTRENFRRFIRGVEYRI